MKKCSLIVYWMSIRNWGWQVLGKGRETKYSPCPQEADIPHRRQWRGLQGRKTRSPEITGASWGSKTTSPGKRHWKWEGRGAEVGEGDRRTCSPSRDVSMCTGGWGTAWGVVWLGTERGQKEPDALHDQQEPDARFLWAGEDPGLRAMGSFESFWPGEWQAWLHLGGHLSVAERLCWRVGRAQWDELEGNGHSDAGLDQPVESLALFIFGGPANNWTNWILGGMREQIPIFQMGWPLEGALIKVFLSPTDSEEKQLGKAEMTGDVKPWIVGCWRIVSALTTPLGKAQESISSSFCSTTDVVFTQQILRRTGL